MVGRIALSDRLEVDLRVAESKFIVIVAVGDVLGDLVHRVGDPVVLVLLVVCGNEVIRRFFCRVQPALVACQTVKARERKGRLTVVVNGARRRFQRVVAIVNVIVAAVVIHHIKDASAQRLADVLVFLVAENVHILGHGDHRNAAAAEFEFVRLFLIEERGVRVLVAHGGEHIVDRVLDQRLQTLVLVHPVAQQQRPDRRGVTQDVVVFDVVVETRVDAVDEGTVPLDLID